jgi:hypothetical protein
MINTQMSENGQEKASAKMRLPLLTTAVIPDGASCILILEINPKWTAYLAELLFQAELDIDGGAQVVVLPGGVMLIPFPQVSLTGCHYLTYSKILGKEIYDTVEASLIRKGEGKRGASTTQCNSSIVQRNASMPSVLKLNLGLVNGMHKALDTDVVLAVEIR